MDRLPEGADRKELDREGTEREKLEPDGDLEIVEEREGAENERGELTVGARLLIDGRLMILGDERTDGVEERRF